MWDRQFCAAQCENPPDGVVPTVLCQSEHPHINLRTLMMLFGSTLESENPHDGLDRALLPKPQALTPTLTKP